MSIHGETIVEMKINKLYMNFQIRPETIDQKLLLF